MSEMTGAGWRDFVLERPRTAKLATVRADGRPHVAPIWIDLDGDTVVFNTGADSAKGRRVRGSQRRRGRDAGAVRPTRVRGETGIAD